MQVLQCRGVNEAYAKGVALIKDVGVLQDSRAGKVLVAPFPVTTSYSNPTERVLFDPQRDANHVFHLMESLHMLAGRNDATWLDQFIRDFSSRFAEEGGRQHGAYGWRWRNHFRLGMLRGRDTTTDQLQLAVELLSKNPDDRRVVIQMWDPSWDFGSNVADVPCNMTVIPRIQGNALDITVFCRSNDLVWGCAGANAVHFSVLQEYLAAHLGLQPGVYYQISNNYHAYVDVLNKVGTPSGDDPYDPCLFTYTNHLWSVPTPIVTSPAYFDDDLYEFMRDIDSGAGPSEYDNPFFGDVAYPLFRMYQEWRLGDFAAAFKCLEDVQPENSDWKIATTEWLQRREEKARLKDVG